MRIILLPGMDGTGLLYEAFGLALGADAAVTVVTYPVAEAHGYAELEAIARASLPRDEPYVLLAESFSGPIGISIAASNPPGLQGLILCCTFARRPVALPSVLRSLACMAPVKFAPEWLVGQMLLSRFGSTETRQLLKKAMAQVSVRAFRARLKAVLDVDALARLATIHLPMLYLQAKHDRLVSASAFKTIQLRAPTIELATLDAPHFLLQSVPADAAKRVSAFIQSLCDAGYAVSSGGSWSHNTLR